MYGILTELAVGVAFAHTASLALLTIWHLCSANWLPRDLDCCTPCWCTTWIKLAAMQWIFAIVRLQAAILGGKLAPVWPVPGNYIAAWSQCQTIATAMTGQNHSPRDWLFIRWMPSIALSCAMQPGFSHTEYPQAI